MVESRRKRWWIYRAGDALIALIIVFIALITKEISDGFLGSENIPKIFFMALFFWVIFMIGWYMLSFYYLLILFVRMFYWGSQIPTLKLRFLSEIGVFILHSVIVAFGWYYFDVINLISSGFFWIGWPLILLVNLYIFYILEGRDIRLNKP